MSSILDNCCCLGEFEIKLCEQARKQAIQETLDLIMFLTGNLSLEFGESEYKAIKEHFGLLGEVKCVEPQKEYLTMFAEYLKDYARQVKENGYDGIGEIDIDEKLKEFLSN